MDKLIRSIEVGTTNNNPEPDRRFGYDAAKSQYGDLIDRGIIDPVKVTRYALEHANSVVGLILTCNSVVLNETLQSSN
jgi:chaperonin GroEL (HSP60 family)